MEELGFCGSHVNDSFLHEFINVGDFMVASDILDGRFFYACIVNVMAHPFENLLPMLENDAITMLWSQITDVPLRTAIP